VSPASATCPSCGGAVDPLGAPVARIVGGRVVTFCSAACADGRPAPVAAPRPEPAAPTAAAPRVAVPAAAAATVPIRAVTARRVAGAVPEPAAVSERAAGVVTEPARRPAPAPVARGGADVPAALLIDEPDLDDEVIELRRRRPRRRTSRRARVVALSAAIIAGGAAVAVLSTLVSPSRPTRVDAATDEHGPPVPRHVEPTVPAAPTAAALYARAQRTLTDLLASPSHRVHRVVAEALSRTGDPKAIDWLAHALDTEPSAISRMEEAYALARAGDPRGRKVLVAGLGSPRRDVKSESARRLLVLGDHAGAPFMTELMGLSQNRLGAAELLARAGDAKALAVLREVASSPKAPHEAHMRAVFALARAGQPEVAAEVRAQLDDPDYGVKAAPALAYVGDRAAVPALVKQLDAPSLRVRAAVALRHLADHLDTPIDRAVWIDHIAAALDSPRDVDQASAAEAALILFGPPTLAEHE
jgi:HEAT repeat protein